jgi:cobalt-zinc-cadmium efflux system protein
MMASEPGLSGPHTHFGEVMKRTTSRLALALFVTLGFVVVEALAGVFANSLALLTDAAHNLTDVIALGLSWYAVRLTAQPSNSQNTYGYHRAGILVALVNSTTLVLISLGVFYEAYHRLLSPPEVKSEILIAVGLVALVVNLITARLVRRRGERDLNLRAVFLHLMGDVASTSGAVIAGIVIYFTRANWLDPLVSVLIGCLIVYTAWGILRETVEILLESTPRDLDVAAMVEAILSVQGVLGVHDLHVWSLTHRLRTMSAHILTEDIPISAGTRIQNEVTQLLVGRYNISHATLQLECAGCDADALYCDIDGVVHSHQTT